MCAWNGEGQTSEKVTMLSACFRKNIFLPFYKVINIFTTFLHTTILYWTSTLPEVDTTEDVIVVIWMVLAPPLQPYPSFYKASHQKATRKWLFDASLYYSEG